MPSMRLDRTSEDSECFHQLVLPTLSCRYSPGAP